MTPTYLTRARHLMNKNVRLGEIADRLDCPRHVLDLALWKAIGRDGPSEVQANALICRHSGEAA